MDKLKSALESPQHVQLFLFIWENCSTGILQGLSYSLDRNNDNITNTMDVIKVRSLNIKMIYWGQFSKLA